MITISQGGEGLRVEMKECHKSPVSSTNSWIFRMDRDEFVEVWQ